MVRCSWVKLSPGRFSSSNTCTPYPVFPSNIYSAMKRISNDQTALARVVSCVYRVSQWVTGAAGRVGWVTVVICNRSTPCLSLRLMMVSVCARENDARPFPTRLTAQCRQLSSTILLCRHYVYVILVTNCASTPPSFLRYM
jgi:hypothetical protein